MKKIFLFLVVASLATFMFSCSKTGSLSTSGSSATGNGGNGSNGSPTGGSGGQAKSTFVSEWFSVQFEPASDPFTSGMVAEIATSPQVNSVFGTDVKLVYARHAGREFIYDMLPVIVQKKNIEISMTANFTSKALVLTITNSGGATTMSDATLFDGYHYRYLSVPLSVYKSLSIDWTNYEQVAIALNFPI